MSLGALGLAEAAAHIREGRIRSVELVQDCLARIDQVDAEVQAWAFLDREHALRRAEAADLHRQEGKPVGPLHGVPVGIKDIFDTADMPTELGSPIWAGRTPRDDAWAVSRLARPRPRWGGSVPTEISHAWSSCRFRPTPAA